MDIKKIFGILAALVGILFGLMAIFKIVVEPEVAVGFVTMSFGILAIIWISMAIKSLSKGSSLKIYTINFLLCVIFLLLYLAWNTTAIIFGWRATSENILVYPSYVFLTLAFLVFVSTSHQVLKIGKEFGFGEQAKKIEKAIKEKTQEK